MQIIQNLARTTVAIAVATLLQAPVHAQSLKDAVEQTVKANPDVRVEAVQRLANNEALTGARGGYLPKVDVLVGYGREWSKNPVTNFQGRSLNREEGQLTLTQMLFDGFGVSSEVNRQKARVESAAYKTLGTAESAALQAIEAYMNVLRNRDLVELTKTNLATHLRTQDQIGIRSKGGIGRKSDQEQIDARVGLAKANLVAAQANLRDSEINFLRVVGAKPDNLTKPVAPDAGLIPKSEEEAVQRAIDSHPILKSAAADVEATNQQHQAAKSFMYPRFDAELGYGKNRNLDGSPGDNDERYAMLRMRYNIFKGGSDYARVHETGYLNSEAKEVMNRTRRQVDESTRLSWNALYSAIDRLPALREHAEMSAATRDSYVKQFNLGQRTLLDLLDSENEAYTAQSNYVNATYLEQFARYRLMADFGQLLSFVGVAAPEEAMLK